MTAVVDTNVFVSALLNPDGAQVLNLVIAGKIQLLYDSRIVSEYEDVLARSRFGLKAEWVDDLIDFIESEGAFVVSEPIRAVFADEDDKKFYEVAKSGSADFLITGNKRHFPRDAIVATPKEFIEKL